MRWACTTVQYGLQWCTLTMPPLERTHTSNPAFPTGGGPRTPLSRRGVGEAYSGRTCLYLGSVPPLSNPTPRSRFDNIDVGGLGGFVSFVVAGVGRRGHPLRGGWSHSPPVGKGGDVDDDVTCVRVGGYGGGFCFKWSFYDEFVLDGRNRNTCTYGGTGGYVELATVAIAAAARCCCCSLLLLLAARCCC